MENTFLTITPLLFIAKHLQNLQLSNGNPPAIKPIATRTCLLRLKPGALAKSRSQFFKVLIFMCTSCFGAQTLTFSEIDNPLFEGKEVVVVGFLACNELGEWFLAKQPNIKTCCLDKEQKIRLMGNFSNHLKNRVIHVQGTYQKGYCLESAQLLPE